MLIKKTTHCIIASIFGASLLVAGFTILILAGSQYKNYVGVCVGIGTILFFNGIFFLIMLKRMKKNPELCKQHEIEYGDERNIFINNKAKAKTADVIQWFMIGAAFITILVGESLWLTLLIIGVYVAHNALFLYYMFKYNNEV